MILKTMIRMKRHLKLLKRQIKAKMTIILEAVYLVVCKKKQKIKMKKWSSKMKTGTDSAITQVPIWRSTCQIFNFMIRKATKTQPRTIRWLNLKDSDQMNLWPLNSFLKNSSTEKSLDTGGRERMAIIFLWRISSKLMLETISKSCPTTSTLRSATN